MGIRIEDYSPTIGQFEIRITGNRRPFKFNFPVYTYQEILLTNFRCTCTFPVVSLSLLQSLNPNIDILFSVVCITIYPDHW